MSQHLRLSIRVAFFACLASVLFFALNPHPFETAAIDNDKGQHFIAFLILSGLGRLAWPSSAWSIALTLSAVGGAIELLQGTPLIGRDMSLFDWLADSLGVVAGSLAAGTAIRISPLLAPRRREGLKRF